MGKRIRQGFIAESAGMKLISADYSQVELRILAHLSQDPALREAFEQDADIHSDTAARIFGVMPGLVTADMRRQAKAVNFGVVYGISAFGLSRNLGISRAEAARFIDHYFAQYPRVRAWIDRTIEEARDNGYVTTLLQRRRVPDLNSRTTTCGAERVAINTRAGAPRTSSRSRWSAGCGPPGPAAHAPASARRAARGNPGRRRRAHRGHHGTDYGKAFPLAAPLKVDIGMETIGRNH